MSVERHTIPQHHSHSHDLGRQIHDFVEHNKIRIEIGLGLLAMALVGILVTDRVNTVLAGEPNVNRPGMSIPTQVTLEAMTATPGFKLTPMSSPVSLESYVPKSKYAKIYEGVDGQDTPIPEVVVNPVVVVSPEPIEKTPDVISNSDKIPESIIKLMKARPDAIPEKFKAFEALNSDGRVAINVMWGGEVNLKPFDILTKDGKSVGTALASRDAYFFGKDGNPEKITVPTVVKLTDGRLFAVSLPRDFPLGDGGWEELKQNNVPLYRNYAEAHEGEIGYLLVNPDVGTQGRLISIYEGMFSRSWKDEIDAFLTTGKPMGLNVVLALNVYWDGRFFK